jgi:phosphopantothenoylcysteine decarboxylase/phosphopantothenate--cysteine ligase
MQPPTPSDLDDHDLPRLGEQLLGKHIALLVCGGIAAMKAPMVARELRRYGAEVTAFVSAEGLRYVAEEALAWSCNRPVVKALSAQAEHLSGDGFDAYVVAPATYNTLNKFRYGIADTLLTTTLASALGRLAQGKTQILVAPTMHGSMHNPILDESVHQLQAWGVEVIPPRDAYGKHNLPDPEVIAHAVCRALSSSPLKGLPVLVTGGPTPVPIDSIRRITTRFTGQLGFAIARELYLAGADVHLIHGATTFMPPAWLPHTVIESYQAYRATIHAHLSTRPYRAGIFSAAVADYGPSEVYPGKIASGGALDLFLHPLPKVIQEVRAAFPALHMVTFKFEQNLTHEALMAIAQQRLQQGSQAVVANRAEEQGSEQVAWLVRPNQEPLLLTSKSYIADALCQYLATALNG